MTANITKATHRNSRAAGEQSTAPSEAITSSPSPARESKAAMVTRILQQENGASLDELAAVTGWQRHTTRAALTGLRKKGHTISKQKADSVTRYTITASTQS